MKTNPRDDIHPGLLNRHMRSDYHTHIAVSLPSRASGPSQLAKNRRTAYIACCAYFPLPRLSQPRAPSTSPKPHLELLPPASPSAGPMNLHRPYIPTICTKMPYEILGCDEADSADMHCPRLQRLFSRNQSEISRRLGSGTDQVYLNRHSHSQNTTVR